jgi:hypothetical protein
LTQESGQGNLERSGALVAVTRVYSQRAFHRMDEFLWQVRPDVSEMFALLLFVRVFDLFARSTFGGIGIGDQVKQQNAKAVDVGRL